MPQPRSFGRRSLALAASSLLLVGACSSPDEVSAPTTTGAGSGTEGTALVVGGSDASEMQIMQNIYAGLLEGAGYTVTIKSAGERAVYAPALESGEIDVVPEYAASMAEYLNRTANGSDAAPIATNEASTTIQAMTPLAEAAGLTVLTPAQAQNTNGFYVTKTFSDDNGVTTLSQLAARNQPVVLAAGDDCRENTFCQPGLERVYGLQISSLTGDPYGSASAKQKVVDGAAQLGETGTTDGTLDALGLVLLEDDKNLQAADNLVPIVNTEKASDPKIADALNKLAPVLTTEDLAELNLKVDAQRERPADVAKEWLEEKGLV
ncbi:ABC transporter substrate-binding protein [Kineococcus gynurae]|uniref:ABC transporter substrate-binding protein n=1 Tax=Kineococcus gynurae TaxID=452979 RepID=A0ABV5LTY3_9ACTN